MSLGAIYRDKFKVGDYVYWRTLDSGMELYYKQQYGIIIELTCYEDGVRPVHYAKILENKSGEMFYVVLSSLVKVETN